MSEDRGHVRDDRRVRLTRRQLALSTASVFAVLAAILVFASLLIRHAATDDLYPGVGGVAFTLIGVVILWRRPGHGIGRLTLAIGLMFAAGAGINSGIILLNPRWGTASVIRAFGDVVSQGLIVGALVAGMVIVVVWFPDGRRSSRLGAVVEGLVGLALASSVIGALIGWLVGGSDGAEVDPRVLDATSGFSAAALLLSLALALFDIALRYRRADPVRRAQIRWVLAASATSVGMLVLLFAFGEQVPGLWDLFFVSTMLPAIAIAIAITRYRLYDIDRIISRTLGYGVVTGVLAAMFALTAIGLSAVLGSLAQGESLAVAAATLFVVGLFGPLRRRAQSVVDRRFDRARYDASLTVQALTARLRDDVDIDRVQTDVLGVVDQTFHPAFAGLWLR
jgi:MFS family permease